METLFRYVAPPSRCGYRPDRFWSLEYQQVGELSLAEYHALLIQNWRRFGTMLFRPACTGCSACRSLRVPVATFQPDRSQRRCREQNDGSVTLRIGKPSVSEAKLALYDRYHAFQSDHKGWPQHPAKEPGEYGDSFVDHPFPVEEWCYYVGRQLVGVGYVDVLAPVPARGRLPLATVDGEPMAGGLSAIYFFYDPDQRRRSLGTWNVLRLIAEAARRGLPHVYLGYYVEGSPSMVYKGRFRPNQLRGDDGVWRDFR
jgi:arginine-tRNA-protein transferase